MDKYFNYDVEKGRQFLTYSSEGLFVTNIGINGVVECKGIVEIITGITSSNIMCKYTEANGDTNFTQFKTEKGAISEGAGINSFIFVAGEGRWEELVGKKCIGAFSEINAFEKNMSNATFEWKGKCEMSNKMLERIKNYRRPE